MSSEPTAASGVPAAAGPEKASSPPPVPPLPRWAWGAVTMALGLTMVRRLGAASWAGALVAILVLAVARPQLEPRPEAIVPALVLLAIALFEGARSSGRDRTRWLIPGQVLWTNVH